MKNWILSCFLLLMTLNAVQVIASPLIEFKNGDFADAEDINSNFKELENRIDGVPVGPVENFDGMVIQFSKYKHQYRSKTFSVMGRNDSFDREMWEFTGADWSSVKKFRATSDLASKSELYTDSIEENANGEFLFVNRNKVIPKTTTGITIAVPNGSFTGIRPGILIAKNEMVLGHVYSSGGMATSTTYNMGKTISSINSSYIDTVIPVAIETVIAGGVEYLQCLKMERRRKGVIFNEYQLFTLSWYCPGEGLVKEIRFVDEAPVLTPAPAKLITVEPTINPMNTGEIVELIAAEI